MLAQRLSFSVFFRPLGVVKQEHQTVVIFGECLGEVVSLKAQRFCEGTH
jgi:hypothetical protein